jgi:adenine phosphoribosyltransferase
MGEALSAETFSITTGAAQTLYLDEKDQNLLMNKKIALMDDVISTGSTLQGMRLVTDKAGAEVVVEAAIFTEGDRAQWKKVIALGHLPVFIDESKQHDA